MTNSHTKQVAITSEAILLMHEDLREAPDDAVLHIELGDILMEHFDLVGGSREDAIAEYRTAIHLDPHLTSAYSSLGEALRESRQEDEAFEVYKVLLRLDPHNKAALNNTGLMLRDRGQDEDAIALFLRAIAIDPLSFTTHYNLSKTYLEQDKLPEAEASFQITVNLGLSDDCYSDRDLADAYRYLGNALKELGKHSEAADAYREAIRLDPEYHEAITNLGTVFHDQGHYDEAIALYTEALGFITTYWVTRRDKWRNYYNLADAFREKQHLDAAIVYYKKALRLQPQDADTRYNLALTLQQHGDRVKARRQFTRVIEISPDSEFALLAREALKPTKMADKSVIVCL